MLMKNVNIAPLIFHQLAACLWSDGFSMVLDSPGGTDLFLSGIEEFTFHFRVKE